MCADGWIGADCSVDISAGPRVANLANNGLCDVRSKPCRSVIVSGDNFADSKQLVCHVEVFKVSIAMVYGYLIMVQCNLTIIPIVFHVVFGLIALCIVPTCNII